MTLGFGSLFLYQSYTRGPVRIPNASLSIPSSVQLATSTMVRASSVVSIVTTTRSALTIASVTPTIELPPHNLSSNDFGIAEGETLLGLSSEDLNSRLGALSSLGITWIRFDIDWNHVQPNDSTTFYWDNIDQLVSAANAHNINLLAILDYTPTWARSSACLETERCAPADPFAFAQFAQAAAERYGPQGITAWEIWNEPNLHGSWEPAANALAYTQILKAAYIAIKNTEPSSTVIIGGMGPGATNGNDISPIDFLSEIYADNGGGYFDAVGYHPYTFPGLPSDTGNNAWSQMSETSPSLRSVMAIYGDQNKKIWITEFGAPTSGPDPDWYVSEAKQAQMVTNAFQLYSQYNWVGPLFWYTFQDGGTSTSTNENFFGLTRYDGSTKPAYSVLQNIISANL